MNDNTLYSIYFANLVLFPPSSLATEDNDEDEEDAGVNSTWVVPSRSSFTPCRAKKGPCSHACSVKRGQGELRCA